MAEDGRPSERGHCLLAMPRALALFVVRVVLRPDRWFTADPYPPEAAEAPALDCGCQPVGGAVHTCMHCGFERCYRHHYAHQQACFAQTRDPVDEHAATAVRDDQSCLAVQPAEDWTGDESSPAIVAGQDLDGTVMVNELAMMLGWHDAGVNVYQGAPRDVVRYG